MNVLIACEFSGIVRDAFAARGHFAVSCDLLPSETDGYHYQGDIFDILNHGWDLMIAHPPCTYLCNSGVCWLGDNDDRWQLMIEGAEFFKRLLDAPIPKIAIENPIMHKYAKAIIGSNQSQIIQPYQHGHAERKATCLWLKELTPISETNNVYNEMMLLPKNIRERLHYLPPTPDRWRLRSMTYPGIAAAMAQQWG